jgi:hypothetical protein
MVAAPAATSQEARRYTLQGSLLLLLPGLLLLLAVLQAAFRRPPVD